MIIRHFDTVVRLSTADIAPMVTWGTTPGAVVPVTGVVPNPADEQDEAKRAQMQRMLDYMALTPGQRLQDLAARRAAQPPRHAVERFTSHENSCRLPPSTYEFVAEFVQTRAPGVVSPAKHSVPGLTSG